MYAGYIKSFSTVPVLPLALMSCISGWEPVGWHWHRVKVSTSLSVCVQLLTIPDPCSCRSLQLLTVLHALGMSQEYIYREKRVKDSKLSLTHQGKSWLSDPHPRDTFQPQRCWQCWHCHWHSTSCCPSEGTVCHLRDLSSSWPWCQSWRSFHSWIIQP